MEEGLKGRAEPLIATIRAGDGEISGPGRGWGTLQAPIFLVVEYSLLAIGWAGNCACTGTRRAILRLLGFTRLSRLLVPNYALLIAVPSIS